MKVDIRELGCRYVSWNADRIHLQVRMVTRMNLLMCKHLVHPETTACFPYPGGQPVTYSCGQSLFGSYTPALPACRGRGCGLDRVSQKHPKSGQVGMSRDVPSLQPHNRSNGPPWPPRWRRATCATAAHNYGQASLNGVHPEKVSSRFVCWLCGPRHRFVGMGGREGLLTGLKRPGHGAKRTYLVSTLGMLGLLLPLPHTASYLSTGTAIKGGTNLFVFCFSAVLRLGVP
jgi:hypothetical protein